MLRKILTEPDPILRKKCEPLEKVDGDTKKLMDDMLETMYAAPGIGLAAVQVGILKRLVVIDISKGEEKKKPIILINPQIIHKSEKVPPPPLAYSKKISLEDRKKIKSAVLEAHKHGEIGGYGGTMSHYISVSDSDYDVLRNVVKLLNKKK